jgi:heat-inducible transcriptional repressor
MQVQLDNNVPVEDIIQRSCEILSNMTNLTSVVLGPDANRQTLAHIRLFPLDSNTAVAVFITDQGHTENKTFRFEDQISLEDIQTCTNILNDRLVGTPISDIVEKMNELKPILAHSVKRHEALFNAFMQAFVKFASENVYYSGASNMLYQPEFADIEKMRNIMKMLEDSKLWRSLDSNDSLKLTSVNDKNQLIWFDDMAVVSSKFRMGDEEGKLMIVGPSRMDYNRIVSVLDFAAEFIEEQFKKRIR